MTGPAWAISRSFGSGLSAQPSRTAPRLMKRCPLGPGLGMGRTGGGASYSARRGRSLTAERKAEPGRFADYRVAGRLELCGDLTPRKAGSDTAFQLGHAFVCPCEVDHGALPRVRQSWTSRAAALSPAAWAAWFSEAPPPELASGDAELLSRGAGASCFTTRGSGHGADETFVGLRKAVHRPIPISARSWAWVWAWSSASMSRRDWWRSTASMRRRTNSARRVAAPFEVRRKFGSQFETNCASVMTAPRPRRGPRASAGA